MELSSRFVGTPLKDYHTESHLAPDHELCGGG